MNLDELEDARGAISVGLEMYKAGQYPEALAVFEKALALPGTGTKRYRDKPREISSGEKMAALYKQVPQAAARGSCAPPLKDPFAPSAASPAASRGWERPGTACSPSHRA